MPIYEYRCEKGHTFDIVQRMADDALDSCEMCGAPAARVLHAPAVHFKGSGFYNTDYGTKKRARERSAADSKGRDKSGGEGKSGDSRAPSTSDGAKKADAGATTSSSSAA
jgi:putative FmdB family regulatory protein